MSAERKKHVRRPAEERIAEIDRLIEKHKSDISKLEAKKESIMNPKPRSSGRIGISGLMKKAKESGMTPEEIADKLGLK